MPRVLVHGLSYKESQIMTPENTENTEIIYRAFYGVICCYDLFLANLFLLYFIIDLKIVILRTFDY